MMPYPLFPLLIGTERPKDGRTRNRLIINLQTQIPFSSSILTVKVADNQIPCFFNISDFVKKFLKFFNFYSIRRYSIASKFFYFHWKAFKIKWNPKAKAIENIPPVSSHPSFSHHSCILLKNTNPPAIQIKTAWWQAPDEKKGRCKWSNGYNQPKVNGQHSEKAIMILILQILMIPNGKDFKVFPAITPAQKPI